MKQVMALEQQAAPASALGQAQGFPDRVVLFVAERWLLLVNLAVFIFVGLPILAPFLAEAGLEAVPPARVAAVYCASKCIAQPRTTPEGLTLHTLWGEIAYRLGQPDRGPEFYEIIEIRRRKPLTSSQGRKPPYSFNT